MKALIIAAGYATRLYPLTRDFPKHLLQVGPRTILDYLMDQLDQCAEVDEAHLVTNHRFAGQFKDWSKDRRGRLSVEVLDDGTSTNADRLGAIGDIRLGIEKFNITDDLLVCGADNIYRFSLGDLIDMFRKRGTATICVRRIEDVEDRKRRGIAVLDEDQRVVDFTEKPEEPKSEWAVPPLYIYPSGSLGRVAEYLEDGNPDAPGHFIEWLCKVDPVYAYPIEGSVLDIGNPESLEEARRVMGSKAHHPSAPLGAGSEHEEKAK